MEEGPDSLVGRLESTAGYADTLADWMAGPGSLARSLAEMLSSAEAVTVVAATGERAGQGLRDGWSAPGPASGVVSRLARPAGGAGSGALAAAGLAARVLAVLSAAYDGVETLLRQWGTQPRRDPVTAPTGRRVHRVGHHPGPLVSGAGAATTGTANVPTRDGGAPLRRVTGRRRTGWVWTVTPS